MNLERRMSDAEALMWTVEKDPSLRASFLNITLLDRAPDFDRLRRRMQRAVHVIPRLHQRVVSPPARVAPPQWVDDPNFDIDYHLRRIAVPSPGDDRQLLNLAASLYEDAFDRARPLWMFHVVEGLSGGRAAFLAKMHHTITDGVGGLRLSMQFIDVAHDAPDPDSDPDSEQVAGGADEPGQEEGLLSSAAQAAGNRVRRNLGIARRTVEGLAGTVSHPTRVPAMATESLEMARSLLRQMAVVEPSRSPLWTGKRSLGRHFEAISLDLDGLKATAKALGGTVNDVYVTGIAGAAGAYHREHGVEVGDLRMSMPVNMRADRSAGGNAFSPARVLVPAGTEDPVERFNEVHARLATTKSERALGLAETLAGVLNGLPTAVVVRLARQQVETVDFATSNLRGANFDLYVAGAHVLANHPMGPTAGTAFNATVLGYKDSLDLGLNVDTAAVDDPARLGACVEEAFAELVKLGR